MSSISIRAHFDGKRILLDEPIELEPNTRLLITVLPKHDAGWDSWVRLSSKGLEDAYGQNEDEYTLDLIKEANPEYEGR